MMNRRTFVRSLAGGAATLALVPKPLLARSATPQAPYFGVHPFVETNPSAVFIMRTNVDDKTNSAAVREAGLAFAGSVLVPMLTPGIPLSHLVAIKANVVMMASNDVQDMGIVTDANFVEGVIESLKSLGMPAGQIYMREANFSDQFVHSGYADMALRTGIDLRNQGYTVGEVPESDIIWVDVPNGRWFKKIPFVWPVNAADSWLLNIAKFKTHSMGMSLCTKNLQGTNATPYVAHCREYDLDMGIPPEHVQPDAKASILADYNRHVLAGIPRWDRPGDHGGLWQEIWSARCLDNNSVLTAGLHIIEGIYGREGPFYAGPGPNGEGVDHLTNLIIFGKNPFHVDLIGHWLGGHEPGNFGLFHLAIERGLATYLNPMEVPVFEWRPDGPPVESRIEDFPRYALRTQYLRRDYNGETEDEWHLVAEPYAYTKVITKSLSVEGGWTLVSLPVAAADAAVTTLFPSALSSAFEHQNGYVASETLTPGKGYWVKFPQAETFAISGAPIGTLDIEVQEGWNLIGPLDADVPSQAIIATPSGIVTSSYFSYSNGYAPADVLLPGKGYWVKASQAGVLRVVSGVHKTTPRLGDPDPPSIRLEFRDARGNRGVLRLAEGHVAPGRGDLPPLPPMGVFDVRFSGDRWIEQKGGTHVVQLTSVAYPLAIEAISLRGTELRVTDAPGTGRVNCLLREGSSISLPEETGSLLIESIGEVPASYELEQNYPNPFNPSTTIRFGLPSGTHVRLSVFNPAGQRVATLLNEELAAGHHTVPFNGTGLSSGPYLYRLEAAGQSIVKRMLFLK